MTLRSAKVQFALVLAILFCLVIALWLPFSFNSSPLWDGWGAYYKIDFGQYPLIRLNTENMRPFTNVAWHVAYRLDPNSFTGLSIVLITMFVAKGAAFYLIIRRVFPEVTGAFALAAAAIATAHPGDPEALYLGAIGGHLGIFLFLISIYLVLIYVENGRWPILAAAIVISLISMGFSERTYPLVALTPLLVLYKTGKLNRRALITIGWWLASILPVFALYLLSILSSSYRRVWKLTSGTFDPIDLVERIANAFKRIFVEGWILPSSAIPTAWLLMAVFVGVMLVALLVIFSHEKIVRASQTLPKNMGIAIVAGLVIVLAGFIVFAPLASYGTSLRRALYLSVFGGALTVTGILYLITSYLPARRYLFPGMVGIVVCLGIINLQFVQHNQQLLAAKQHTALAAIVEALPSPQTDSVLFITFKDKQQLKSTEFPEFNNMQTSLSLVYGRRVVVCRVVLDLSYPCTFKTNGLQLAAVEQDDTEAAEQDVIEQDNTTRLYPYEKVIAIQYGGRGGTVVMNTEQLIEFAPDTAIAEQIAQRYNPQSLFSADSAFPSRYHTMLLSEVTAPLDTLPLMTEALALSPFSKVVAPQGNEPFILIEGEGLTAAEHLGYPQQNALETDGEHSWLWLGDGVQQGVTFYLQADTPMTVQLALTVEPGPSRQDQTRTLEIRNLQTDAVSVITFDEQTTVTSDAIALDAGLNTIQITVLETPDTAAANGDPRSLLVLLDSVQINTLAVPTDE